MATVGSQLASPEAGWKRYESNNPAIKTTGTWGITTGSFYSNSHELYTNVVGSSVQIKFNGTKFRYLGVGGSGRTTDCVFKIDGIEIGHANTSTMTAGVNLILVFEKTGLVLGEHIAEITLLASGQLDLDAIDIDSTGRLFHPDEVIDVKDLAIGKRIRCHYQSATSGAVGTFSGLGQETYVDGINDFIPPASSATPNGDFYYICVDVDHLGRSKILADRNVQHSISWDVLNTAGISSGSGLPMGFYNPEMPIMTSNTSNGIVVSASTMFSSSYDAWYAFDRNNNTMWNTPTNTTTGWLKVDFGISKIISSYSISAYSNNAPKNWTFEGSNTGAFSGEQVVLDTRALGSELSSPTNTVTINFNFNNKEEYRYYRLNVTANGGGTALVLRDMQLSSPVFPDFSFATRLLTGGTASGDLDNEWDKYIVNSTLGGSITAGSDAVWNWNVSVSSWISSTTTSGSNYRAKRGWGTTSGQSYRIETTLTSVADVNTGFRPALLIESLFTLLNKSFILFSGEYRKFGGGNPEQVATYTPNIIPVMTSNTAPSGVASASSIYNTSYDVWKAFDAVNNSNQGWITVNGTLTGWLQYQFPVSKVIKKYSIKSSSNITETPKNWTFQGSNTGSFSGEQVILDTRTNEIGWASGEKREYIINNSTSYLYYRINITANNGNSSYTGLAEMEMMEELTPYIPAIPSSWQTVSATLPSLTTFKSEGIDDLSVFNRQPTIITLPMDDNTASGVTLGSGKVFKEKVDLLRLFDLISLDVK